MYKNRIKNIACFLALIILLAFGFSFNKSYASNGKSDDFYFEISNDSLKSYLSKNKVVLKYWDLSNYNEFYTMDQNEAKKRLDSMSDDDLNKKFSVPMSVETYYEDGKLFLKNLSYGTYYFRNSLEIDKVKYDDSFVLNLDETRPKNILLKFALKRGKVRLKKISDDDKKALSGVEFVLYDSMDRKVSLTGGDGSYSFIEDGKKDMSLVTDKNGEIVVDNLSLGSYYFYETKTLDGYKIVNPRVDFVISESDINNKKEVILTVTNLRNKKTKKGSHRFIKIDDSDKKLPLSGASFKVTRIVDGKESAVIKDGKELIVNSDQNGEFWVRNLDYGKYRLWEVEAPKEYKKLKSAVDFAIDDNSKVKVIAIKNSKNEIKIPNTGDLIMPLVALMAVGLFATGFLISRTKEN